MHFIRDHILHDYKLKILSLGIAVMIWFGVSHMGESRLSVSVRPVTTGLAREYVVARIEPEDVLVTVSGPVSTLRNVRARDINVSLDLSALKKGSYIVSINRGSVTVAKGVRLDEINPETVAIELDRIVEKRLKVVVKLDPRWSDEYRVDSWSPQIVTVTGGEDLLRKIDVIETYPVDGLFKKDQESAEVALNTKDMLVRKLRPETIRVVLRRQ